MLQPTQLLKCSEIQSCPNRLSFPLDGRCRQFRLLQKCGLHLSGIGPRLCWKWSASLDNSPARGWKICPANQYPLIKTMHEDSGRQVEFNCDSLCVEVFVCVCVGLHTSVFVFAKMRRELLQVFHSC